MNAFYNLRIASKLLISFVVVLALTVFVGVFSVMELSKDNQMSTEITTNWMPATRALLDMKGLMARYRSMELQHILSSTDADMASYEKSMTDAWAGLEKSRSAYEKLISEPEEKKVFPEFVKAMGQYALEHDKVIALSRVQKNEEAVAMIRGESLRLNLELSKMLDTLAEVNEAGARKADETGDAVYRDARLWVIGSLLGSVVLGLLLALWIARIVAKPLAEAVKVAQSVAAGDLTSRVEARTTDETGQLMRALKEMNDSLVKFVGEVRTGTDTIATA